MGGATIQHEERIPRTRHVRTRRRPTCPSLVRNCCKIFVHCLTDNGMPRRSPRRRSSKRRSGSRRRRNYRSSDCTEWICTPDEGLNTLHDCHVDPLDKYTVSVTRQRDAMIGEVTDLTRRVELLTLAFQLYRKHGLHEDNGPLEDILPVLTQDFAAAIHYLRYPTEIETYFEPDDSREREQSISPSLYKRLSLSSPPSPASPPYTSFKPTTPPTRT